MKYRHKQPIGWKIYYLSELTKPIKQIVGKKSIIALSISAKIGFVPQIEKFGRDISGKQYNNYILLRYGEFAYNKGNSYSYPQGCVYRLENYREAAVPNVFECFSCNKLFVLPTFLKQYFEGNFHGKQLFRLINSGVRNNGLLNLTTNDFYNLKLFLPPIEEQKKIVEVLESWDKAINLTKRLIAQKELQKKYLMQQLLTGRTRLKGFNTKWKKSKLKQLCAINKGQQLNADTLTSTGLYPCLNGGIIPSGYTDKWNREGNTISISEGGNSCGYVNFNISRFWAGGHCYTLSYVKINNLFLYCALKAKENLIMKLRVGSGLPNIQRQSLEDLILSVPSVKEQKAIAEVLSSADKEIDLLKQKLTKLEEQKKGLMQVLLTGKIRLK